MAAKVKKAYFCRECGYDTSKWLGKCPSCGAWNSFAEEVVATQSSVPALVASRAIEPARPQKVQNITLSATSLPHFGQCGIPTRAHSRRR